MPRFVISLTTLPKRLPYIQPVIDSIIKHNPTIDRLYICLPYGNVKKKYIPKENNIIKVIRCHDYGPITKILGCLDYETDPNTLILTLDDDIIVSQNLTRLFLKKSKIHPNAALSMSGWCYGSYPFNYQIIIDNTEDVSVDWIQGVHGILYKRSFINKKEILKFESKNKLLFKNDDHKISAYLFTKGIKRISINSNPVEYFKNFTPASRVNPISGDSFYSSVNFWNNVMSISSEFKKKGYYGKYYSVTYSVIFLAIMFLILAILIPGISICAFYYFGCLDWKVVVISLFITALIVMVLFKFYKSRYILNTSNR